MEKNTVNAFNTHSMRGVQQPQHQHEHDQATELQQKFGGAFDGRATGKVVGLLCGIQNRQVPLGGQPGGLGVIDQFRELAGHAAGGTRLTVDVSASGEVGLSINQDMIARLQLTNEECNTLLRLNGVQGGGAVKFDISPLKRHEIEVQPHDLTDKSFVNGGKYKKFCDGVLRADHKVADDFDKEAQVNDLAAKTPALQQYVSTQQKLALPPDGLANNYVYATVPMYNKDKVTSCELDDKIARRPPTREQSRAVALQCTDMLKQFYLAGLKHGDLHMHNLMVREVQGEPGCADQTLLQAIDFGKSESRRSLDDVRYAFKREADHTVETLKRNVVRSEDDPKQQKHYPLHKLLAQYGGDRLQDKAARDQYVKEPLKLIGNTLESELQSAAGDKRLIEQAFDNARKAVDGLFDQIARLPVPANKGRPVTIEMVPMN